MNDAGAVRRPGVLRLRPARLQQSPRPRIRRLKPRLEHHEIRLRGLWPTLYGMAPATSVPTEIRPADADRGRNRARLSYLRSVAFLSDGGGELVGGYGGRVVLHQRRSA